MDTPASSGNHKCCGINAHSLVEKLHEDITNIVRTPAPIPAKVWHERMGHLNWEALKAVKTSKDLSPLKGIVLADDPLPHSSTCPGCQAGKAHRRTYKPSTTRSARSTHPLERVHSDLVGPIPTTSINGHRYAVSFTCDYSSHVWSLPMKSKDQTLATFRMFGAQVKRQYGLTIRYFRSDRGGEFMSKEFSDYLASEGIIRETSAPDTPQQNGLAERMQQTIWSGIRAVLHHSGMKHGFWAEALAVIVHVMNRAPRKRLDWRTPHEVLTGQVPNVAYFRTFGCRAWVYNNKGKKLDAKALPMVFVGYEPGSKAYRLWDPSSHRIVISSDVTFDETLFPNRPVETPVNPPTVAQRLDIPLKGSEGKQDEFITLPLLVFEPGDYDPSQKQRYIPPHKQRTPGPAGSSPGTSSQVPPPATRDPSPPPQSSSPPIPGPSNWQPVFEDSDNEVEQILDDDNDLPEGPFPPGVDNLSAEVSKQPTPVPAATPPIASRIPTPSSIAFSLPSTLSSPGPDSLHSESEFIEENLNPRRSERKKKKTAKYTGGDANLIASEKDLEKLDKAYFEGVKLYVSAATSHGEPRAYHEAVDPANPDSPRWIEAIQAELKSLQDHGTWKVVPRPEGKRIVSCKWVWRIKVKEDGSVERYKARLVARGFTQTRGVDFNETFAPVTRLDTIRLLAANAAQRDWEFRQIDVKTAYLYGELDEEVYMEVPQGLEGVPEGHVLLLIKALYGLKQAGRQWYNSLRNVMEEFNMKRIEADPHTFIVSKVVDKVKRLLIVPVYVDDLFPFGDKVLTDDFERYIPNYFETSPPCDAHYFLGIRVTRNRTPEDVSPYICLDQITFIGKVLSSIAEFFPNANITDRRTVLPAEKIEPNTRPKAFADRHYVRRFQSAVGQLMYIMLATRPDLAYPVGMLARHASNPSPEHEKALLHLAGYLGYTINKVLIYRKAPHQDPKPGLIEAYSDADWAGEEHSARSTSGMIVYKNNSAVCWGSWRQGIVSSSTMESEYIAMFRTVKHAVLLHSLETQFGLDPPRPILWCDNKAAIAIATGGGMNFKRSKFMNVKYHYVRRAYEKNETNILYVESQHNIADPFTKRLSHGPLEALRGLFMEEYSTREILGGDGPGPN